MKEIKDWASWVTPEISAEYKPPTTILNFAPRIKSWIRRGCHVNDSLFYYIKVKQTPFSCTHAYLCEFFIH